MNVSFCGLKENMKYGMVASPCVDGELLTKSPLTAMNDGDIKDIPYIIAKIA